MSTVLELEANAKFKFHDADKNFTDHKAWAKRILYRDERGDKDLTSLQINFARMAMDIKDEVTA